MVAWLSDPSIAVVFASLWWLLLVVSLWEGVWKGVALWKSGNNHQLAWFVCIFIFNTMGILPIIYLLFFQKGKMKKPEKKSSNRVPRPSPKRSSGSKSSSRSKSKKRR
jgi:methionyl-tRNA synthetase